MNSWLILTLLCAASFLMTFNAASWWVPAPPARNRGGRLWGRNKQSPAEDMPRMVRQLASLLSAGRTGPFLWGALAQVLSVEAANTINSRGGPGLQAPDGGRMASPQHAGATITLVLAVQRSSALGLPASASIRDACASATVDSPWSRTTRVGGALSPEQCRLWVELAACFAVCESSGAAMAGVLNRLAAGMEAERDAVALRETALAGPRATVRLLSWLPFLGVGLGVAMGVDPLGSLLGGPLGWTVLASGVAFTLAGRAWSALLIAAAAGPSSARTMRSGGRKRTTPQPERRR